MANDGHPTDFGYHFKLSMYWGSKWKVYFTLYYAFTYEAILTALDGYSFPVGKNKGWAIENLNTREVYFERYVHHEDEWQGHDDGPPDESFMDEEPVAPPPILLPASTPTPPSTQPELFAIEQVWVHKPPIKRRL